LDQNNRIPQDSSIFDNQIKTIVLTKYRNTINQENTIFEVIDFKKNIAPQIVQILYQYQIQSVIIEGGLQTLQTFIDANLWDEARIFIGKSTFENGIKAPQISKSIYKKNSISDDELIIARNHD
jgi:diaminohydroxyphosphoribosylaminopyrimidine deaminase/5-amino-6-(5-phosphoribosylamino)uracil reductase